MTEDEEVEIREVQTARLRLSSGSAIVRATEAIRETGLDDGSFRFDPDAVDEIGLLPAYAIDERVDGRSNPLARAIHHEGRASMTLTLPPAALEAIGINIETIDWEDPPELNLWAGDGVLAVERAERRTIPVSRGEDRG